MLNGKPKNVSTDLWFHIKEIALVGVLNGATSTTGTILNFGASLAASVVGWFSHVLYRQSTSTLINGSTFYYGAVTTAAQIQNSASLDITQANTFYFNGVRNGTGDTITLIDCYVKILR